MFRFEDELDIRLDALIAEYGFNMFLHAPEDEGKTEDATEGRKRKAREEEGRVFMTQELPQAMVLITLVSMIYFLGDFYKEQFSKMFQDYFVNLALLDISYENMGGIIKTSIFLILKLFLPLGVVAMIVGFFFYAIQTNFFFSTVGLKLDWKRIAFSWSNFKKKTIFSRLQLINTAKSVFKVILVSVIGYYYIKSEFFKTGSLMTGDMGEDLSYMAFKFYMLFLMAGVFLLMLALPDWYIQKSEYDRNLKMTKDEVKREYKEMEGDPLVKSKIRQRARELATRDMINSVKQADVLITNPTHFSCAVKYSYTEMDAPKLIGKGQDEVALRMREMAKEFGVPIVENKPLARGLYANVEINQYVPVEYYSAIAEILAALDKYKVGA